MRPPSDVSQFKNTAEFLLTVLEEDGPEIFSKYLGKYIAESPEVFTEDAYLEMISKTRLANDAGVIHSNFQPVVQAIWRNAVTFANRIPQLDPASWRANYQAASATLNNRNVQEMAIGAGTAATATGGFMGTISSVFAAESLSAIGALGAVPVAVAAGAALLTGAAGYGVGTLIDHAAGWIRDDGRSVSDLLSGANAGVPVADPTGHGKSGWRFVADEK